MRGLLIVFLLSVNLSSFAQKNNFTIDGVIEGEYVYKIFLRYKTDNNSAIGIDVEKVSVVEDGKFFFTGFISEPVQAHLILDSPSTYASIYLDSGNITVKATAGKTNELVKPHNVIEVTSVKGSASDSLKREFIQYIKTQTKPGDTDSIRREIFYRKLLSFVQQYPSHNLSSEILADQFLLSYTQSKIIFSKLSASQKSKAARNNVSKYLERTQKFETPYPFIALPDTAGNLTSGSNLQFKYLLIDFWASWCEYCRREDVNLYALYKKYHASGFEVLGVSLDDEREEWINAIRTNKFPWTQISDLKGRKNAIAEYYPLMPIPFNILIDKNGRVISVNLYGKSLDEKIKGLLSDY